MHQGGLLANTRQLTGLFHQRIIQVERGSHVHRYALTVQTSQPNGSRCEHVASVQPIPTSLHKHLFLRPRSTSTRAGPVLRKESIRARHRLLRAAAAILFSAVLVDDGTAVTLPNPTTGGSRGVGYLRTTFVRSGTLEAAERRLDTTVWYPADVQGEASDPLGHEDAPMTAGRHPLLVYSHGGCAFPEVSSFLTKALASWGFIVVAPSHPGDTVYDGFDVCDLMELRAPTLAERVDDVAWVIDALRKDSRDRASRFFRHLARAKVGVLGWSSGGSTAIVAGRGRPRLRGVLSLAPDARPERIGTRRLRVPAMVMVGALDYYDPQQTSLDQVYAILRSPRFAVHLRRTGHFAFSDPCLPLPGGADCGAGTLAQEEAHRLVLRYAVPFLLRYVAGTKAWGTLLRPGAGTEPDAELRAQR